MSDPRVATRNGWFKIVNTFFEAMVTARFSPNEMAVFGMLVRATYGERGSDRCDWTIRSAAEAANISRRQVERAWAKLMAKNAVVCYREAKGKTPGSWGPNEQYWEWKEVPKGFMASSYTAYRKSNKTQICVTPMTVTQTPDLCHHMDGDTNLEASAQNGDTRSGKSAQNGDTRSGKSAQNGDTDTHEKAFAEAIVAPPKDMEDMKDMYSPPATLSYSYLAVRKDDPTWEKREMIFKIGLKELSDLRPTSPLKETNKRKLAEFLSCSVPEGMRPEVYLKCLLFSVRKAVAESRRRRQEDPKRVVCSVGTALHVMPEQLALVLEEIKSREPAPPAIPAERKRDRRWVIYPAGSFGMPGRPHYERWEGCWADELTDEERALHLQQAKAWMDKQREKNEAAERARQEITEKRSEKRRLMAK